MSGIGANKAGLAPELARIPGAIQNGLQPQDVFAGRRPGGLAARRALAVRPARSGEVPPFGPIRGATAPEFKYYFTMTGMIYSLFPLFVADGWPTLSVLWANYFD